MGHLEIQSSDSPLKPSMSADAINCTTQCDVGEVRLSVDAICLAVDLPKDAVARIRKFIAEIPVYNNSVSASPFQSWRSRHYEAGFRAYLNNLLVWEPTGGSAFVCETGSKRPGARNTVFRWNPSKCDSVDIASTVFNDCLGISAEHLFESSVSHIHLALDIPHARVDDQAMSYPKMTLAENKFSSGRTMYLGARSGRTRIAAYDKKAELITANAKLGTYLAELKEPVPSHDLLRIEFRLKLRPSPSLEAISALINPFARLRVHSLPANLTAFDRLGLTVARYEGLRRAVADFSSAQKKVLYRKLAKAGGPIWWQPNEIWQKQYGPLIDKLVLPFMSPPAFTNAKQTNAIQQVQTVINNEGVLA